ncbi:MAG: fimbria/pilus periplasmic chaperone [Alphaproteobacteria bacterium]|nr:fimbria/pilus periplasmic chaperone [Alphaproteobacteria bacterium]MBU1513874.1 fimbria/pilus periplasmic chaperone [Alphaproteobacteria bacterium]MBU2094481.1 fimbria/pilus periplasmic chaperone [Alphaproteobacteria bacterium]MBU2149793.1 fimbria/pilus periplasmic chaperone [Alphaproteobacteria bacterium]MBU2307264.1 fimbria/pilus periplasmic chaperone [Alphaproteobacteria bacterium]
MRAALLLGLAILAAVPSSPVLSQTPATATAPSAFLNITPKRLTFDRNRRNGTIFLLNQGTEPVTVDLWISDRVMLADGQIFAAEDAAKRDDGKGPAAQLKSAKELLQVSPRRVTLQPGRPQTVRVRLTGLPDAASGEHRSHLTITTIPPRDAGTTPEAAAGGGSSQLSFQILAVYGLSIPLVVRPTDPDVRAAIEGAHLEPAQAGKPPVVALDLVRQGESSAFGNFEVRTVGERKGAEPLGVVRGVAVYPEVARRTVRILLARAPAPGEKLEVTFTDDDTSPGKVLAKAAF